MLAFVDTETTGLDPANDAIWEVAILRSDRPTFNMQIALDQAKLSEASLEALYVNRFYDRYHVAVTPTVAPVAAAQIARLLQGMTIAGSNPAFDMAFLSRFLRRNGQSPAWHYKPFDVITYAAGLLGIEPPISTTTVLEELGLGNYLLPEERHTALGDARLVEAVYDTVVLKNKVMAEQVV